MKQWYYVDQCQQKIGPLSNDEMLSAFIKERVKEDTLVWHQELDDWQPLEQVASYVHPVWRKKASDKLFFLFKENFWLLLWLLIFFVSLPAFNGKGFVPVILSGLFAICCFVNQKSPKWNVSRLTEDRQRHIRVFLKDGNQ